MMMRSRDRERRQDLARVKGPSDDAEPDRTRWRGRTGKMMSLPILARGLILFGGRLTILVPRRPRRSLLGVALAVAVALWPAAGARAGHEDGRILIFAQPFVRADGIWMAQTKAFFKDEGLTVSVKWVSAGTDALKVFQEGREGKPGFGDLIVVSDVSAVNFWESVGRDFVVITQQQVKDFVFGTL